VSVIDDFYSAMTGIPHLPENACRQDPELWDDTTDPQPAVEVCLYQCKAYDACREWAQAQAADTLVGIVAGEIYLHPSDRPRKTKEPAA
jgi:hypothetical protein